MKGVRELWAIRPDVDYLNHGSFGACPHRILERQRELRDAMEEELVDFLSRELPGRLAEARGAVGRFAGADPEGIAFVPNATAGVNAVFASFPLGPGDEILVTDHAYPACRKAAQYAARRSGGKVVTARVPFPLEAEEEVVEAILAAVNPRTRIALIDHVTSPTALVFPVARIVKELRERGVESLVDAAHALGMVPLDLDGVGAAWTTANAHKWLCAPKGAAILHVREDLRGSIHPTTIGDGFDPESEVARFREEFDWTGTTDPTPWLCIPECIRYLESLVDGGWPALMARNRALALRARAILGEALGVPDAAPESMIGAMAAVPFPGPPRNGDAIVEVLRGRGIEAHAFAAPDGAHTVVRVSAQLYNDEAQYRRLAAALTALCSPPS